GHLFLRHYTHSAVLGAQSDSKRTLLGFLTQDESFSKPASNSLKTDFSLRVSEVGPPDTTFFPEPGLTENGFQFYKNAFPNQWLDWTR
ncbi:MAG: hypothetical protein LBF22_10755, partial [Deltaproteobacteria bacterium]|nr:hypothetical protein [Deltaproteobacteria bacterium]